MTMKPGRWRKRTKRGELRARLTPFERMQLDGALERMQQDPQMLSYLRAWDRDHRRASA